jgi:signal transduction histidine kinase/CheY-like chemotaxis protein
MPADQAQEDLIQAEHVRTVFRQFPVAVLAQTLNAAVMAALLWVATPAPRPALEWWFAAVVGLGALRVLAFRRFRSSPDGPMDWRLWSRVATAISSAYGLIWAAAILMFLEGDDAVSLILLVVIPIGLTSGAAATGAAIPAFFFSFSLIVVAAMVLALIAHGGLLGYALATLAVVNLLVNISICLNIHRTLDKALRLRLENEAMRREAEEKNLILEEARAEAERANSAKTRFLAAASHDLRQPIHALGLFFSALSERIRGGATETLVRRIEETIGVIGDMLNALLDISKLDAGVVEPRLAPVSVDGLFQRLEDELAAEARERGNRLRFRPCGAWVQSDPAMLERILRNLVGNALRYTKGGRVLVAGRRRGKDLRLEVRDTGCGIPKDRIADCFVEFQQINNPQRDRTQGLGLGLAIVQRLARLLGHRLEVRSELGRGSLFAIRLPLLAGAQAATASLVGQTYRPPEPVERPLRVLVLDDDRMVREAMDDLLSGWGYQVSPVASLDEALSVASGSPPDLLIADYRLPGGVTGADAIMAIHRQAGHEIPALVITGDTAPGRLRESATPGHPLLHKPVDPAKLRTTLRFLASRRG